jgi:hypothetical protein
MFTVSGKKYLDDYTTFICCIIFLVFLQSSQLAEENMQLKNQVLTTFL